MAAAAALLVLLTMTTTSQLSASASSLPLSSPAPVGKPGCNTTCGDVEVPYPLGFGPSHCYWPGLNLTCDTSQGGGPRLLLGDGTLRVTEISLQNSTVRVVGKAGVILGTNTTTNDIATHCRWDSYPFGRSFGDYGYRLSSMNELSLYGCNVVAALLWNITHILGGCSTFCNWDSYSFNTFCVVPVNWDTSALIELQINSFYSTKLLPGALEEKERFPVYAVVAEQGWSSSNEVQEAFGNPLNKSQNQPAFGQINFKAPDQGPLILQWAAMHTNGRCDYDDCPDDVRRKLCKSHNSYCITRADDDDLSSSRCQYTCQCDPGYGGNPYLDGGCQGQASLSI